MKLKKLFSISVLLLLMATATLIGVRKAYAGGLPGCTMAEIAFLGIEASKQANQVCSDRSCSEEDWDDAYDAFWNAHIGTACIAKRS